MSAKMQEEAARSKHVTVALTLNRELVQRELKDLKHMMVDFGDAERERMKDIFDVFNALERRCLVSVGNYDYLIEILRSIHNTSLAEKITQIQTEIRSLMKTGPASRQSDISKLKQPVQVQESLSKSIEVSEDSTPILKHEGIPGRFKYSLRDDGGCLGHMVIINEFTKHREGSQTDVEGIKTLFEKVFRFKVDYHENVLREEFIEVFRSKAEELERENIQRFCSIIMSHGDEKGIMTCSPPGGRFDQENDARVTLDKDIIPIFSASNLPRMAGRPKCFFVQACRGTAFQEGQTAEDAMPEGEEDMEMDVILDTPPVVRVPDEADVLLAYAQAIGQRAFRDKRNGSWFIQAICDVFSEYHESFDVLSMMTMVCEQVGRLDRTTKEGKVHKQSPVIQSTLRKRIYMLP